MANFDVGPWTAYDHGSETVSLPEAAEGPAAALVRAMLDDGVDLSDEAAVAAWIDDFNAGPSAERDRVLGGSLPDVMAPPVTLPDDEALATAALATPAMTQLVGFVTWLDDRRSLTRKGNLTLADGTQLVELLGTDDRVDESFGGHPRRTRSTTELFGVDLVYRLAVASGLAQRTGASLHRTDTGLRLASVAAGRDRHPDVASPGADPVADAESASPLDPDDVDRVLACWRTVVHEMIRIGLVTGGRPDRYGLRWWEDTLNDGVVDLLATLLLAGGPLPVDGLVDDALEQLADEFDLDGLSELALDTLPDSIAWAMGELTDRLVWLGLAGRDHVRVEVGPFDIERRRGGHLRLTPLGTWFIRPLLIAQGVDVPVAGALADADAGELLDAVEGWTPDAFEAEVARWVADRPTAASELTEVARAARAPDRMGLAFEALDVLGVDAERAVRELGDDPWCRPFVMAWLDQHALAPLPVDPRDPAHELVRSLAAVLVAWGSGASADAATAEHVDVALVERLWRVEDPWTTPVLEALGEGPDKRLAKAARRALFKRRNRN